MDDASPEHDDEGQEQSADYRHDALGELMTGAYAATSMVAMTVEGGDANLPAPPAWAAGDDAPKAEALDETSGVPAQIDSGRHPAVEEEIDFDFDDGDDEAPELRDHIGSGPESAPPEVSLRAAIEELPASSDDLVAQLEDEHIPLGPVLEDDSEPAAAISTDSGVVVTPQHAKGAQLTGAYATIPAHLRSPAPRKRSPMPWVLGGLAVVLGIGLAVWATNKPQAPGEPSEPAEAAVVPSAAEEVAAVGDPAPEPGMPETEPKPSPAEQTEAAETSGNAYAAAAAKYEREPNNETLLEMTLAACELRRGPDARTAFRKLVGGKARSKAVIDCREDGIDVTSKVEGFTAGELAEQARAALEAGDAEKALELAKQSNKTERNQPALRLVVTAHCHLGQKASAKKMMRHISKRNRRALSKTCAEHGVRIR